jgi:patatin-related protein
VAAQSSCEFEREVRFAVVIYGGVSLAIYINGVVQEMLRLVRSTALPEDELKHSEKVYRKLACILGIGDQNTLSRADDLDDFWDLYIDAIPQKDVDGRYSFVKVPDGATPRTRFVVDILSGTSAGGINSIYLAKALANRQTLDQLASMWINVADINRLLNDKGSAEPPVAPQHPPPSLLNSRWMYLKLLQALDGMDDTAPGQPMVDELDLFTTTTDLDGVEVAIPLADRQVYEKRFKNVFQFQMRKDQEDALRAQNKSHFGASMNPFLAFAARCTSAFPFAFEPMTLCDIFNVIQNVPAHKGQAYCREETDYWQQFYMNYLPVPPGGTEFRFRPFGDGGYLDNKPFTYAIETIMKRRADLPVDRKLIYIEPSPEDISASTPARKNGSRPDAIRNSLDALIELPRYETIRQDLEALLRWNVNVARIKRVMAYVEQIAVQQIGDGDTTMLDTNSVPFRAYIRLRLSAVTDAVANRIARALNLDEKSGDADSIRVLAGVWRDMERPDSAQQMAFLDTYDVEYWRRAIRYARKRLRGSYLTSRRGGHTPDSAPDYAQIAEADGILAQATNIDLSEVASPDGMHADLALVMDPRNTPRIPGEQITPEMTTATEAGKSARARWLLERAGWLDRINWLDGTLTEKYAPLVAGVRQAITPILERFGGERAFLFHDSLLFPLVFGTELGEVGQVDVTRISPQDAAPLEGIDRDGRRGPLKGAQFGAFGGFLDKNWRLHDMVRGRLDGAERLISAILPATDERTTAVREALISEAQNEIADDWQENLGKLIAVPPPPPSPPLKLRLDPSKKGSGRHE